MSAASDDLLGPGSLDAILAATGLVSAVVRDDADAARALLDGADVYVTERLARLCADLVRQVAGGDDATALQMLDGVRLLALQQARPADS